jgi:hypothetical protein
VRWHSAGPGGGPGIPIRVPRAHAVHVLTPGGSGIAHCVAFLDPEVFAILGSPDR